MLTKRQKQVYEFINQYSKKHGISPTHKEIGKKLKLSSVATVHEHLEALERKGYLKKDHGHARAMETLNPREDFVTIPLLGTIAAGQPIEAIQQNEFITVSKNELTHPADIYALRVIGDSMIDENINDGDIVLVRHQETAENGQKIVALLDNYAATLKKYYKEDGYIRLQPANKKMEPIIIRNGRDISIQGVVLDVIHGGKNPIIQFPEPREPYIKQELEVYYKKPGFTLYNGNSLDILSSLPESSVDMVFADPPYNLSNGGFSIHAGRMVSVNKGDWDKSKGFKDDYNFHHNWLVAVKRILKPGGTLWVSGTYHSIYQCGHALQSLGYHILNDISWFKPNAAPNLSCRFFTASHETLIWARKEKTGKHTFNYKAMKDGEWSTDFIKKPAMQMRSVWAIGTPKPEEKKFGKHPTQKPYDLLKRIVLASTNRGDIIVDPFTGSSTTGIAAYLQNRSFIGIDTEKKFLDLSIKRLEDLNRTFGT
jgi:site-specific DNA-methyltransferase (adenine-specific)